MAAEPTERDLKREQLRRKAARRRQAVLDRIASTRRATIGGVAVVTCAVAVLIDVATPVHAATAHSTAVNSSTSSGTSSSNSSGSYSDSATQSLSSGSTPSASSGGGTVVSGGS